MDGAIRYLRVKGARIAFSQTGTGFPLLLLHGFPRTHRVWDAVSALLGERFSIIAPDRRGYGDSDRTPNPSDYDNASMTSDSIEVLRQLDVKRVLVGGHDKGVAVARRLAADYPDVVVGAVMMDGAPESGEGGRRPDPSGRSWYLDFFRQRGVAEAIINANPRLFFSLFLDRNPHLSAEEHEFYVQMFCRRGTVEAILADYRAAYEVDRPYWQQEAAAGHRITVPILVIWGERGPMANAAVIKAWKDVADDVRGAAIVDSAHYVQEEQPDQVARHILAFADALGIR